MTSALSAFELFRDAPHVQLEAIAAQLQPVRRGRGQALYCTGDESQGLFLLEHGFVRFDHISNRGSALVLGIVGPGNAFGELELIEQCRRVADAVVVTSVRGWQMSNALFYELFQQQGWFSRNLCRHNARSARLHQLLYRNALTLSPQERLARTLLGLDERFTDAQGVLHMSQEVLAQLLGVSRQSINVILQEWQAEGWLELGYGRLRLLDREALVRARHKT